MTFRLQSNKFILKLLKYGTVLGLIAVSLFPIYIMVISSFMPNAYIISFPPKFITVHVTFENYLKIFVNPDYLAFFKNSFITSIGATLVTLLLAIPAGYSFSRYGFIGKNVMMTSILSVQMFPIVVILISLYTFYLQWGMLNTYGGLILAHTTFSLPLAVLLMKSFFDTIPRTLDEAAKIDGAGRMRTMVTILLPLTKPGLVAIGIYTFLHSWDDFILALVIMQETSMKTLSVGIAQSFLGEYAHDYGGMMAFAFAGSLPILILFAFFQKYMVMGLTAGAVKG